MFFLKTIGAPIPAKSMSTAPRERIGFASGMLLCVSGLHKMEDSFCVQDPW